MHAFQPRPPSRPRFAWLALATSALLPLTASAAVSDADLQRCRAEAAAAARLACYDALPVTGAAAIPAAGVAAAGASAGARFGLEHEARKNEPDAVESTVAGRFEGWEPNSRITLANGQVWRVIDDSRAVMWIENPTVRVERASLGSFMLHVVGKNDVARVRRVQ
jgi:hypothetical protein